jgi:hypothetical protein
MTRGRDMPRVTTDLELAVTLAAVEDVTCPE